MELFEERNNILQNIKKDAFLQRQRDELISLAEELKQKPIAALTYGDFSIYYKTGSRREYEDAYFAHRMRLDVFALLCIFNEDDIQSLKQLQDIIWAIADEFTWALPAHIPFESEIESCKTKIDLFSAETAFALAEILYLLGDCFDKTVSERIRYEIRKRVFEPYLHGEHEAWETVKNNWAAVCAGSVGSAFLYLGSDEEIKLILPRVKATLECYLQGFGSDGACVEGMGYWRYGFGNFVYFAQLLYQYSDGKDNLFDNPKVKEIALFQQRVRLSHDRTVSFSDVFGDNFCHRSGLSHFLKSKYEETVVPDDSASLTFHDDKCYRFVNLIRDFAWRNCGLITSADMENTVSVFPDAEWYIKRNAKYDFAAKAGNNGESHNHNDIASFMLNISGESVVIDPGRGEYSAAYFSPDRYKQFAPSAEAHSVPVFNGQRQKEGETHKGEIKQADENMLVIGFEGAYDYDNLKKAQRSFNFEGNRIILTDYIEFQGKPERVTEHFVLACEPKICDGYLLLNESCRLNVNQNMSCAVYEHTFSNGRGHKTVYLADLEITPTEKKTEIVLEFCF